MESETASGPSSAEVSSAEVSSSEVSATESSAAPAAESSEEGTAHEWASPSAGMMPVVVIVCAAVAVERVSAVGAEKVGAFGTHAVFLRNDAGGYGSQGMLVTTGASGALAGIVPQQRRDNDETAYEDDCEQSAVSARRDRLPLHAAVECATHGLYAGCHAFIPTAFSQVGIHVSCLYLLAECVGQITLQSVSGDKLDTPF